MIHNPQYIVMVIETDVPSHSQITPVRPDSTEKLVIAFAIWRRLGVSRAANHWRSRQWNDNEEGTNLYLSNVTTIHVSHVNVQER